jgi:hypothetical protein
VTSVESIVADPDGRRRENQSPSISRPGAVIGEDAKLNLAIAVPYCEPAPSIRDRAPQEQAVGDLNVRAVHDRSSPTPRLICELAIIDHCGLTVLKKQTSHAIPRQATPAHLKGTPVGPNACFPDPPF